MTARPLLVCRRNGALDILHPDGDAWEPTTLALNARWPAWNPARDLIAYSSYVATPEERSSIEVITSAGVKVRTIYESGSRPAAIAPRVPHYVSWSPGGDIVSFIAHGHHGLTFFLADPAGSADPDPILNDAPLFHAWCTDNNFIAVHHGTELNVVETQGSRVLASVSDQAIGFRTPAYSDDADVLAYAVPSEPGVAIMRAHFQGTGSQRVTSFPGGVALAFRPGTRHLGVAVTKTPQSGAFDELWLVNVADGTSDRVLIVRGPFVSFSWSPDGSHVLLAIPLQSGDGRYQFVVRDAGGAFVSASPPIVPSADWRSAMGFFDQYALSHTPWSAEGDTIVICGREPGDGVSSSFGDPEGDLAFVWHPFAKEAPKIAGHAEFAVFQPKPKQLMDGSL